MAAKITVRITCDGCGKKLDLDGRFRRGRHREVIEVPELWTVFEEADLTLIRDGVENPQEDDGSKLACSVPCALKIAEGLILARAKKRRGHA